MTRGVEKRKERGGVEEREGELRAALLNLWMPRRFGKKDSIPSFVPSRLLVVAPQTSYDNVMSPNVGYYLSCYSEKYCHASSFKRH